ncbi:NF-kappa-B inhibitor cactus [Colletotrichum siamense]|nr:NF-kappa-B inhibitor cactus [Colletotrichum siamense]
MTTKLTTMPPEILLAIADLLPQAALRALSLTNKRLYDVINPVLYAQSVKNEAPDITVLAARDGNLDTLKMAASFGADMNRVYWVPVPTWAKPEKIQSTAPKTGYGVCWATPLHVAAAYGHYDVLKWLLAEGVDVDVPGKLLCGCLSLCEMRDHFGTSSDAWQTRINLDCVPDVAGTWTPLHLAICRGNQSIARLLISRGASLDIRYNRRMNIPRTHGVSTLFYSESCDSRIRMTHFGSTGIEESSNDDLDHRFTTQVLEQAENHNRMHAVHTAASSGQKEILHYLVAKGADINNLDGSNGNALHYALSESDTDMCKLVLDLGVDTATPIDFSEYNIDGSCIMSVVVWAVKYCLGKTDVISRAFSHIAERGDSFWKVDEGSGKAMVISSIFDSGCYDDGLLMQPQYNRWISEFLQGAILTCDSSNVGNLEEDLVFCFAMNAINVDGGTDVLDVFFDGFSSLRSAFYSDSQKLDLKKVILPNTPLSDYFESDGAEIGTQAIKSLRRSIAWNGSGDRPLWQRKEERTMRAKIDWLLDHGATAPKL